MIDSDDKTTGLPIFRADQSIASACVFLLKMNKLSKGESVAGLSILSGGPRTQPANPADRTESHKAKHGKLNKATSTYPLVMRRAGPRRL